MMFDSFESADQTYYKKLLFKLAMVLIIIGAINWLLIGIFDFNLVTGIFGDSIITKLIYISVGLSAVAMMFDRDTYLPFLGPIVAPCSVLENRIPPGATRDVTVTVKPNSKVLYWASEPASAKLEKINSWKQAYQNYDNAGVATSNGDGLAVLKVREPQAYTVPIKGRLEPHIHYRVCGEAGWMDRIQTVFVENKIEGFEDKKLVKTTDKQYKFDISDTAASIF
jgi:uncharacterized membrane protein YuzA (DUF378 family)